MQLPRTHYRRERRVALYLLPDNTVLAVLRKQLTLQMRAHISSVYCHLFSRVVNFCSRWYYANRAWTKLANQGNCREWLLLFLWCHRLSGFWIMQTFWSIIRKFILFFGIQSINLRCFMELRCMLILLFLCVSVCKFVFLYTPPYISQKRVRIYHLKSNFFYFCQSMPLKQAGSLVPCARLISFGVHKQF